LEQGLGAKEKARKRLEDDVALIRREKDESSHAVASLQQQLTSAKEATKRLQETAEAQVNSLQKDIDSLRQDRERQIVLRDSQINVLNAKISAPGTPIQVTFTVKAETVRGGAFSCSRERTSPSNLNGLSAENIFITGSIDPLKRWSPKDAIALKPTNYPIWSGTYCLLISCSYIPFLILVLFV
jgi:multidrug efflux pump subunit AcrA (membrane-fusion protein)